ncbi:MAG: hypothetical protein A3F18_01100 [Legionellales bacterium RIFCSPHIGHO2_12_FULL_37_14]|nr:MAG: hypothetical protein A3F18_01100 [Legionellales bacterium RIFCSPHIGHO2_12_FULL_37_14]
MTNDKKADENAYRLLVPPSSYYTKQRRHLSEQAEAEIKRRESQLGPNEFLIVVYPPIEKFPSSAENTAKVAKELQAFANGYPDWKEHTVSTDGKINFHDASKEAIEAGFKKFTKENTTLPFKVLDKDHQTLFDSAKKEQPENDDQSSLSPRLGS